MTLLLPCHKIRQRHVVHHIADRLVYLCPQEDRRALALLRALVLTSRQALHRRQLTLGKAKHISDHILIQRLRQAVTALITTAAAHISGLI